MVPLCSASQGHSVQDISSLHTHSVATAAAHWSPCCWWEGVGGPAVAMAVRVRRGAVEADRWGEGEEEASCPWVEEGDLKMREEDYG